MLKEVDSSPRKPWEFRYDAHTNLTALMDGGGATWSLTGKLELPKQVSSNSSGISEDILLKSIAVSQNPELIKDIT